MHAIFSKTAFAAVLALATSCTVATDEGRAIDITGQNDQGVVTAQTQRFQDDNGNDVFLLRAFSADGQERASVRLTRGNVAELAQLLPGNSTHGSEIVVTVGGVASRALTRETELFRVDQLGLSASANEFVGLAAISSTLAHDANIVAAPATPSEQVYSTSGCGANYLNTSPTARECCETIFPGSMSTTFHRDDQVVITRSYNPSGLACRAQDGTSACAGASCYWGPNKFNRPSLYGPGGTYANIYINGSGSFSSCAYTWASTDTWMFSDVDGSFPTNQGCPGGATGAGQWDY